MSGARVAATSWVAMTDCRLIFTHQSTTVVIIQADISTATAAFRAYLAQTEPLSVRSPAADCWRRLALASMSSAIPHIYICCQGMGYYTVCFMIDRNIAALHALHDLRPAKHSTHQLITSILAGLLFLFSVNDRSAADGG